MIPVFTWPAVRTGLLWKIPPDGAFRLSTPHFALRVKLWARPAYRDASIYRSKLILASVHVILLVGFTAVISQWALDFSENLLNLCMVYLKFHSNKFLIWQSLIL